MIKLSRRGKNKQPTYRLIVTEKQKDPYAPSVEIVGNYNPRAAKDQHHLNAERIQYWISKGAQPTNTVHNLLVTAGIIQAKKRNVSSLTKAFRETVKKAAEAAKAEKEVKVEPKKEETPKA